MGRLVVVAFMLSVAVLGAQAHAQSLMELSAAMGVHNAGAGTAAGSSRAALGAVNRGLAHARVSGKGSSAWQSGTDSWGRGAGRGSGGTVWARAGGRTPRGSGGKGWVRAGKAAGGSGWARGGENRGRAAARR